MINNNITHLQELKGQIKVISRDLEQNEAFSEEILAKIKK